jgi:hypothetical protein
VAVGAAVVVVELDGGTVEVVELEMVDGDGDGDGVDVVVELVEGGGVVDVDVVELEVVDGDEVDVVVELVDVVAGGAPALEPTTVKPAAEVTTGS